MMEYARLIGRPILCDAHNVESALIRRVASTLPWSPRRLAAEWEWRMLGSYERRAYASVAAVLATSEIDAERIRELAGRDVPVKVVPIAFDVAGTPLVSPLAQAPRILFVGGLHWPPNADAATFFARRILPRVRREIPDAELVIVGRADSSAARALPQVPGVRLTGPVDDVREAYEQSRVMVVPLRSGSGTRVKILEAFARGVPVVSTSIGCEGIAVTAGVELMVADDPEAFAARVIALIKDDVKAHALAAAGRRFVAAHHDIPVVAARLEAVMSMLG
jgi:glycosyltransferase involved in cell wall biosynthesis